MVEEKESISLKEFKAWLVGLVRGKGGALPDLNDWVKIKQMLDKVQEEVVYLPQELKPINPYEIFPTPNKWWDCPPEKWWIGTPDITISDRTGTGTNFTGTYNVSNTTAPEASIDSLLNLLASWENENKV